MDEAILETAGICQNCFIKFNEYDEHQTLAEQIRNDLMAMYRKEIGPFVDVKQEIKVEEEDFYYGFGESIIEVTADAYSEDYRRTSPKKKMPPTRPKNVKISSTDSFSAIKYPKVKSSYVKKDKDAGLLVSIVDGVKLYQCEFCGKKDFTSRSRLKTHKLIHTHERNYMCQSCGASFKTMNCLKNHSRLHNNLFFYCDLCSSKFKGKHELRCHMVS